MKDRFRCVFLGLAVVASVGIYQGVRAGESDGRDRKPMQLVALEAEFELEELKIQKSLLELRLVAALDETPSREALPIAIGIFQSDNHARLVRQAERAEELDRLRPIPTAPARPSLSQSNSGSDALNELARLEAVKHQKFEELVPNPEGMSAEEYAVARRGGIARGYASRNNGIY